MQVGVQPNKMTTLGKHWGHILFSLCVWTGLRSLHCTVCRSSHLTESMINSPFLHTEAENNACANEWPSLHMWQFCLLYLSLGTLSHCRCSLPKHSPSLACIDDLRATPATNHVFPTDRRSSWVNAVTVIHGCMCSHLDSLVLRENNARASAWGGGGGHHRSGSSQRDLVASFYGRGKCDG